VDAAVIDHLRGWIGKSQTDEDLISERQARLMAATVDYPQERVSAGQPLPPLWHWVYFLNGLPPAELGRDGHPARGGFLPPVPLSNRMWAGGRVTFLQPIPIGASVCKVSSILSVEHKQGRSGDLVFVTVLHELFLADGALCLREEHDIVYREPQPLAKPVPVADAVNPVGVSRTLVPTSTLLFRYSALTFNGHRIHYDADYCREVEGYPNLVIHGPLNATLLAQLAEAVGGRPIREFSYRGVSPAFLGETITFNVQLDGDVVRLRALLGNGAPSMQAEARLA